MAFVSWHMLVERAALAFLGIALSTTEAECIMLRLSSVHKEEREIQRKRERKKHAKSVLTI